MSVFDDALVALFDDPNMGRDALWRAGGAGAGVAVRILWRRPDDDVSFGDRRLAVTRRMAEVRAAEASIAVGDTIEVGSDLHAVIGRPVLDADRAVWTCDLVPA